MENDTIAALEKDLMSFDWYYDYSDDHSVWRAGETRLSKLRERAKALGDEAVQLCIAYCRTRGNPE